MPNEHQNRLFILGGASGIVGTICYIIAGFVSLEPSLGYAVAMAWPILSIVFLFSLCQFLDPERRNTASQLAFVFGSLAFTLVAAMLSAQLAVKLGVDEYAAQSSQIQPELFKILRRSLRLVDLGLDVAWDLFMCTSLFFLAWQMNRHPRFGAWWALPAALLSAGLMVLNIVTFPWPPDTRGLIDLGPFAGLYIVLLSGRLLYLGIRMKQPSTVMQPVVNS